MTRQHQPRAMAAGGDGVRRRLRQLREGEEGVEDAGAKDDEEDKPGRHGRGEDRLAERRASPALPRENAIAPVPAAPTAAPSVGVNQPA